MKQKTKDLILFNIKALNHPVIFGLLMILVSGILSIIYIWEGAMIYSWLGLSLILGLLLKYKSTLEARE